MARRLPARVIAGLLEPFWRGRHVAREPVLFIGSPSVPCRAQLLNSQVSEVTIADATTSVGYRIHDDYTVDAAAGCIVRPPGSRLPILLPESLSALEPALLQSRTVTADYDHQPQEWFDAVPADKSHQLPRTRAALCAHAPHTICVLGDSISEGYDATGFRGVHPFQPPYVELIAHALGSRSSSIRMHNHAVAGWTTEDAQWQLSEVARHDPDLVIIAFGMNDATYAEPQAFAERVAAMASELSAHSPDCEFVLVTPMLPTSACGWVDASRIEGYREALLSLERPGAVVADVADVWRALLARKHPLELSGNGTNHPNDFGHRVYAQTVLATLGHVVMAPTRTSVRRVN